MKTSLKARFAAAIDQLERRVTLRHRITALPFREIVIPPSVDGKTSCVSMYALPHSDFIATKIKLYATTQDWSTKDMSDKVLLHDVRVGTMSQFGGEGAIPLRAVAMEARPFDTLSCGLQLTVVVSNLSRDPIVVRGAAFGKAYNPNSSAIDMCELRALIEAIPDDLGVGPISGVAENAKRLYDTSDPALRNAATAILSTLRLEDENKQRAVVLPITDGSGTMLAPGELREFTAMPHCPFTAERITTNARTPDMESLRGGADGVLIKDIVIGGDSQFAGRGSGVPLSAFDDGILFDRAQPGQMMAVVFQNTRRDPVWITSALTGRV